MEKSDKDSLFQKTITKLDDYNFYLLPKAGMGAESYLGA